MKKQCLIAIFTLFLINIVQGQQIDVLVLYSSSSAKQFKNNWAYDLKYNHFIKKIEQAYRLGIIFTILNMMIFTYQQKMGFQNILKYMSLKIEELH